MIPVWEHFEDLEEILYVADVETYELVYLNRYGRSVFRIEDEDNYAGKKCYEVLQGRREPCPFCTNSQLKEGKFIEWTYRNPLLKAPYRIKDTIVEYEGRQYRMEFAMDVEKEKQEAQKLDLAAVRHYEELINECFLKVRAVTDMDEALSFMLHYLGTHISCNAVMIYESRERKWLLNTYSWSRTEKAPEKKLLELSVAEPVTKWYETFFHNEPLLLTDMEKLCRDMPALSKVLSPEQVRRMILIPLLAKAEVVGFVRIDDPPEKQMSAVAEMCKILSHFIVSLIQQRDLIRNLEQISFRDQMTGAMNRYALNSYLARAHLERDMGLIYCDLIGLKRVNDRFGHASGDRTIIQAYQVLGGMFPEDQIFRMGGDEFLVVREGVGREKFQESVEQLKAAAVSSRCWLSIGSAWCQAGGKSFNDLMNEADENMYENKRTYYRLCGLTDGPEEHRVEHDDRELVQSQDALHAFVRDCYFDVTSFLKSLTMTGSSFYIYFGDMRKNLYYISDNLKEDFCFPGNIVPNFVSLLEQRIYGPDQQMHVEDTRAMLREKRESHSVRYRIYDKNGELTWLHCRGIMKWNEDKTEPLFFSGSMVSLKNESEVDPITGLLNLSLALKRISEFNRLGIETMLMCIVLRKFSDVNHVFGRDIGDAVMKEIGWQLERNLGVQFYFYRIDGARFLAVSQTVLEPEGAVASIQKIIKDIFRKYKIHVVSPCAIGVLHSAAGQREAQELVDNVIAAAHTAKAFPDLDYLEFSSHMTKTYQEHTDMSMALNACIEHGFQGFRIVIQPQVETKNGRMFGGEVLLRWKNEGKEISPSKFVPILEQTGMIAPVGKWILEETMRKGKEILKYQPDFRLSVNVSYLQIMDQKFFPFLEDTMERFQIPAENLLIELTETHFDEMPEHLQRFIRQCKQIGIRFALDDFGSAYSGLQLLLQYPADLIKLDRTLMREITTSKEKMRFIMSVVYACHQFGKEVCVEGVETKEELDIVRQTECDFIQGFYFYKPLEWEEMRQVLESQKKEDILSWK